MPKGTFDLQGDVPTVPDNVELVKGWGANPKGILDFE